MKTFLLLLTLALGMIRTLTAAPRIALYQTSFEAPAFTRGSPLRGQDNWEMYHDGEAISVVTNSDQTGTQCLRIEDSLLEQVGPSSATAYCFSRALDAFSNNPPAIVEITASVRLDGPQTGANGTPDLDFLSANLMAVVPKADGQGDSVGGFFVSSAGKIWTYSPDPADSYRFSVPYRSGQGASGTMVGNFDPEQLDPEILSDGRLVLLGSFNRFNGKVVTSPILLRPDGVDRRSFLRWATIRES